jgi:hypothetical protein
MITNYYKTNIKIRYVSKISSDRNTLSGDVEFKLAGLDIAGIVLKVPFENALNSDDAVHRAAQQLGIAIPAIEQLVSSLTRS